MKKIILFLLFSASFNVSAVINVFNAAEPIRASKINENFTIIKNNFSTRNVSLNFKTFQIGELITVAGLEDEFQKVRLLGLDITPLGLTGIKSEELNLSFSQASVGSMTYNDVPVASNLSFTVDEDEIYSGVFPVVNSMGSDSIILESNPLHGTIISTGKSFTYQPSLNYNGTDSFTYKAYDGLSYSAVRTVSITINPVQDNPVIGQIEPILLNMNASSYTASVPATDADGIILSFSLLTNAVRGSVTVLANGNLNYTPSLNQYGSDSFVINVYDGVVTIPVTYSVTITGSGIIFTNGTRTYYDGTVASSCNNYLHSNVNGKNYTRDTGSGVYNIKTSVSKPVVSVYCDMTTDGGGWTFFPNNTYGANTYVDWGSYRTDTSKVLVYMNSGGSFGYQVIKQLNDYASTPIGLSANGSNYLTLSFVPNVVKNKINGMMYNNNLYRFANSDANANSFITFKNDAAADGNNLNVRVINFDLWNTRVGISLPSYTMGWSGGGQYFGGGGVAISSNYFGYTWALGIK